VASAKISGAKSKTTATPSEATEIVPAASEPPKITGIAVMASKSADAVVTAANLTMTAAGPKELQEG
jgi:hypothetical protein